MPSYRLELASTGRAGCQNKECKDQKVKIEKGELRLGSWVDTERFQSFFWRHWGCVTPKVIASLNESVDEESGEGDERDYTAIDGYDEIPENFQEKFRSALEQGHIDDSDWNGDVEMNRPGKNGFRVRKKKADAAKDDTAEEEETPKPKKRGRAETTKSKTQDKDEDEEEEKPSAKKTKRAPRSKKPAKEEKDEEAGSDNAEEANDDEPEKEEPRKPAARRGRPSKTSASEKKDTKAEAAAKPATRRTRKSASSAADKAEPAAEAEAEAEPVEEKPKRGRKKKSA